MTSTITNVPVIADSPHHPKRPTTASKITAPSPALQNNAANSQKNSNKEESIKITSNKPTTIEELETVKNTTRHSSSSHNNKIQEQSSPPQVIATASSSITPVVVEQQKQNISRKENSPSPEQRKKSKNTSPIISSLRSKPSRSGKQSKKSAVHELILFKGSKLIITCYYVT